MIDAKLRPYIDPPLNAAGRWLAGQGVSANALTLAGLAIGLSAALAISQSQFWLGLALIILCRLLDGLDGAVARARGATDFGGYLDIVADFAFYAAIPLAFAFADRANLAAAAVLLACFAVTGISFLAFAVIAAKRGLSTAAHGRKAFFYSTGLAEGTETIAAFIAMCLLPAWFASIALTFAALCLITIVQRTIFAYKTFGVEADLS